MKRKKDWYRKARMRIKREELQWLLHLHNEWRKGRGLKPAKSSWEASELDKMNQ